jgi:hypothetical protein
MLEIWDGQIYFNHQILIIYKLSTLHKPTILTTFRLNTWLINPLNLKMLIYPGAIK